MPLLIYRSVVSCVRICSVFQRCLSACATERMLVRWLEEQMRNSIQCHTYEVTVELLLHMPANGVACSPVVGVSSYSNLKAIYCFRFLSASDVHITSHFRFKRFLYDCEFCMYACVYSVNLWLFCV